MKMLCVLACVCVPSIVRADLTDYDQDRFHSAYYSKADFNIGGLVAAPNDESVGPNFMIVVEWKNLAGYVYVRSSQIVRLPVCRSSKTFQLPHEFIVPGTSWRVTVCDVTSNITEGERKRIAVNVFQGTRSFFCTSESWTSPWYSGTTGTIPHFNWRWVCTDLTE